MIEVDAKNLACPQPILKTKEALEKAAGSPLRISVTERVSRENIVRFLENAGVKIAREEEKNGVFLIETEGTEKAKKASLPLDLCEPKPETAGTTVFINKDRIGHGNDELGTVLMKAFLSTLKDLAVQPRTLCFMNAGVKLTVKNAPTVDALKILEAKGIKILVCGTCLNFFGLSTELAVGKISNMYDLLETMLQSSKVITL